MTVDKLTDKTHRALTTNKRLVQFSAQTSHWLSVSVLHSTQLYVHRLSWVSTHSTVVGEIAQGEPENTREPKLQRTYTPHTCSTRWARKNATLSSRLHMCSRL